MTRFAYIWEYTVEDDRRDDFLRAYAPDGEWVQLFEKAAGYVRTYLYQDVDNPLRFVTTDFWVSKQARDEFRERFAAEFEALDQRCEALTTEERFLGDFEVMDSGEAAPP